MKRTGGNVLILTYNITLANYLKYRLSEIREDFSWGKIDIYPYHQFLEYVLPNVICMLNLTHMKIAISLTTQKIIKNILLFSSMKCKITLRSGFALLCKISSLSQMEN